jgi:hypothetical protein
VKPLPLFAQFDDGGAGGALAVLLIIEVVLIVVLIAGMWATFAKAGKPGWAAIVPIYNIIVMLEIAGKPLAWFWLFLIPIVNIVIIIVVTVELAKSFGKGGGFAVGLILLPFVFYPILGFGDAAYEGPAG